MVPTSLVVRLSRHVPALVVLALLAGGCSSARPDLPRRPQDRHVMRLKGAALIDTLVAAHGGMASWAKVKEVTFTGTDEWTEPFGKVLNPWPTERATGQNSMRVHEGLGRIEIVTDRGTIAYGYGLLGPWALLRGVPSPEPRDERDAAYLVPWHNFLIGVPFRFKESGAVAHYLGRAHRKYRNTAQEFDEVLVTYPPEGDLYPSDWFVVRIDPITHLMRTMTYTTSGKGGKPFETTCEFADYVDLEGIKIPTKRFCTLTSPLESDLHTWTITDLRFNQVSPESYFERNTAGLPGAPAGAAADTSLADTSRAAASTAVEGAAPKAGSGSR